MKRVFLGGTCNNSTWRNQMIKFLQKSPNVEWFNPVVDDWTPACQEIEKRERASCDFVLYTITPKMSGVYSIAEVIDDSNKRPNKTILVLIQQDDIHFDEGRWRSLKAVAAMVKINGGTVCYSLRDAADYIANYIDEVV